MEALHDEDRTTNKSRWPYVLLCVAQLKKSAFDDDNDAEAFFLTIYENIIVSHQNLKYLLH